MLRCGIMLYSSLFKWVNVQTHHPWVSIVAATECLPPPPHPHVKIYGVLFVRVFKSTGFYLSACANRRVLFVRMCKNDGVLFVRGTICPVPAMCLQVWLSQQLVKHQGAYLKLLQSDPHTGQQQTKQILHLCLRFIPVVLFI